MSKEEIEQRIKDYELESNNGKEYESFKRDHVIHMISIESESYKSTLIRELEKNTWEDLIGKEKHIRLNKAIELIKQT